MYIKPVGYVTMLERSKTPWKEAEDTGARIIEY